MHTLEKLLHTGFNDLPAKINECFDLLGNKLGWNETVYYAVMVAMAVILGLWAMRLIKPLGALFMGLMGYFGGIELYRLLVLNVEAMEKCPDEGKYVLGAVLALVLAILGWNRCLHVVLLAYAVGGYYLTIHCIASNLWVGIAGGLIVALLAACVIRFAFILAMGTGSAYLLILSLGKLLPKVDFLQLTTFENVIPFCVFGTLAIVLTLVQRETTRSYACS